MRVWQSKLLSIGFASILGCLVASITAVSAQEQGFYPTYYRVSDVAANDVLNIRANPDFSAEILGNFAPDAEPVEVLIRHEGWGYVALGERMGWVSMKFLTNIEVPRVGNGPIPVGLSCGGTEPFWGFQVEAKQVNYSQMGMDAQNFSIVATDHFSGFAGQDGFIQASGAQSMFTAIINTSQCSDGMSDVDYGWRVDVVLTGVSETVGYSGCCRLSSN